MKQSELRIIRKENFISKSNIIHNNKYDYSLVEYINSYTNINIVCPIHGTYNQRPDGHIRGNGCPKCDICKRSSNTEKFIKKSSIIHGEKYDYSLVDYKNSFIKVKITCPVHGVFEQIPRDHLKGHGCPFCIIKSNDTIINEFKYIHGEKYDYSLVNYLNNRTKVKIICPIHGVFEQTPINHMFNKQGCPKCNFDRLRKTLIVFINQSKFIHNDFYDYSLVDYINSKSKVKIICPKHGMFEQTPINHLKGQGCPYCNESKGEKIIKMILIKNNIKFIQQQKFNECIHKQKLPFDFYLPDYNICIEFDGEQHFNKFRFEKNENRLNLRKKLDNIKNEYCLNNNIHLIRISYNENIFNKLSSLLPFINIIC